MKGIFHKKETLEELLIRVGAKKVKSYPTSPEPAPAKPTPKSTGPR